MTNLLNYLFSHFFIANLSQSGGSSKVPFLVGRSSLPHVHFVQLLLLHGHHGRTYICDEVHRDVAVGNADFAVLHVLRRADLD